MNNTQLVAIATIIMALILNGCAQTLEEAPMQQPPVAVDEAQQAAPTPAPVATASEEPTQHSEEAAVAEDEIYQDGLDESFSELDQLQ